MGKPLDPLLCARMMRDETSARDRFARRLRGLPLDAAVASGEVLGPVKRVPGLGRNDWLETPAYYSRFRKGDKADLHVYIAGGKTESVGQIEIKDVTYPRAGVVQLEVSRKRKDRPVEGIDYFLYPEGSTFLDHRLREAVAFAATVPRPPRTGSLAPLGHVGAALAALNGGQREAFRYVVTHGDDASVQGPPGTGKTQLLKALVHSAVASGLTVGLAAFTHAAIDNAFSRLSDLPLADEFVRVGNRIKIKDDLYDGDWIWRCRADSFSDAGCAVPLVAATAHSWILSSSSPVVDLLIVDEAAQVPVYMAQVLSTKARWMVCLGDHRQLGPVLKAEHAGVPAEDMFSLFIDASTPMLGTQYRMNAHVQSWSATRYYGGNLHPHPEIKDRDIVASATGALTSLGARSVQLMSHSHQGDHRSNAGEAALVANLVEKLLRVGAVSGPQLGVIAPHRMQNGAICRALQERLGCDQASTIRVDTVERFQGQEREVVVMSFGCDCESPGEEGRRAVFLGDARRINVSVTRARSRFYCLASERLMELSAPRRGRVEARELRDFLSWCGGSDRALCAAAAAHPTVQDT